MTASRVLSLLAVLTLTACESRQYDLGSEQAARVGVNYPRAAKRATSDESALSTLFRVTPNLDGGGAEAHAGELQHLLASYGDARFAAILRRESPAVRQSVVDSLDFALEVYVRRSHWSGLFPITYRIAPHPQLRHSQRKTQPKIDI